MFENHSKSLEDFQTLWFTCKCIGILTTSKGIFFQVPIFSKMILVVAGLDFCVVFGSVNSISNALTGTGKIGCCFDLRGWNGLLATKELALLAFMRWGAMILVTVYSLSEIVTCCRIGLIHPTEQWTSLCPLCHLMLLLLVCFWALYTHWAVSRQVLDKKIAKKFQR